MTGFYVLTAVVMNAPELLTSTILALLSIKVTADVSRFLSSFKRAAKTQTADIYKQAAI